MLRILNCTLGRLLIIKSLLKLDCIWRCIVITPRLKKNKRSTSTHNNNYDTNQGHTRLIR